MTDIIKRLRRYEGGLCISTFAEIEAAYIIERLRAKIEEMKQQEPAAYLWTNVQSGDSEVTWDEDAFDREMWHRSPLYTTPGAQLAPRVPDGWLRAVDEALVVAHLGIADESDTYEQARSKLDSLIGFHVDVATDPKVNGGYKLVPIEPTPVMITAAPTMEEQ